MGTGPSPALSAGHRRQAAAALLPGLTHPGLPKSRSPQPPSPACPASSGKPDPARIILRSPELFSQSSDPLPSSEHLPRVWAAGSMSPPTSMPTSLSSRLPVLLQRCRPRSSPTGSRHCLRPSLTLGARQTPALMTPVTEGDSLSASSKDSQRSPMRPFPSTSHSPETLPPFSCQGLWGSVIWRLDFWTPVHF